MCSLLTNQFRYNQEATATTLGLDHNQSTYNLPLYHTHSLDAAAQYSQDAGGTYYQPTSHVYPPVDVRPRFGAQYVRSPTHSVSLFLGLRSAKSFLALKEISNEADTLIAAVHPRREWTILHELQHCHILDRNPGLTLAQEISTRTQRPPFGDHPNIQLALRHFRVLSIDATLYPRVQV